MRQRTKTGCNDAAYNSMLESRFVLVIPGTVFSTMYLSIGTNTPLRTYLTSADHATCA